MQQLETLERAQQALQGSVVAIGNFDGVHRGHQALLSRCVSEARALGAQAVALTFAPHPVRFFRPDAEPFLLSTPAQKAALLARCGVDAVVTLPFDEALAALSPQQFVTQVLCEGLHARHVLVGEGFRFGHRRAGTTQVLRALCEARGVGLTALDAQREGVEAISSSRVREHVRAGELEQAAALLGRPHQVSGQVIHGDARGRVLGFPTANVSSDNELLGPDGIYVTTLDVAPYGPLPACSYLGARPTFGQGPRTFETFVLKAPEDELDLYDAQVTVSFLRRLRGDMAFESADALVAQMTRDVEAARAYFRARGEHI